jgi:hypothetical protein
MSLPFQVLLVVVWLLSVWALIQVIYTSQRRWLSVAYAILAFVILAAIVFGGTVILMALSPPESLMQTNAKLDAIGKIVNWFLLVPSIIAANIPPRRTEQA